MMIMIMQYNNEVKREASNQREQNNNMYIYTIDNDGDHQGQ
jgi:hypothetical protein